MYMEHAREHAKQDLQRRTQEYFSAAMKAKRNQQRQVFNELYERMDMATEDLTQPEKNARRFQYVERVRNEVKDVLQADPTNIIMDYFDDPAVKIIPPALSMPK